MVWALYLSFVFNVHSKTLSIKNFYSQEQINWCWAAITQTVQEYYAGFTERQCKMVTQIVRDNNTEYCCDKIMAATQCNQAYFLNRILKKHSLLSQYQAQIISLDAIEKEINKDSPLSIRIKFEETGHYLLLYGQAKEYLYIYDPKTKDKAIYSYSSLKKYKDGTWTHTYFTKSPKDS
jgi:hypothetical protein